MIAPIKYEDHPKAQAGDACSVCNEITDLPVVDHCHEHGWARGVVCPSCNQAMAAIDRRRGISKAPERLVALIKHFSHCPDCTPITADGLGPARETVFVSVNLTEEARDELRQATLLISPMAGRRLSMSDVLVAALRVAASHQDEMLDALKGTDS